MYQHSLTPEDLSAFAKLAVVPGVTVGDLAYVQSMSLYSTGLIDISTVNQLNANTRRRLFQTPIGKSGQGFAGSYSLTRSETNLEVDNFAMDGNEVFVATHACWSVCLRTADDGGTANQGETDEMQNLIPSLHGLWAILNSMWWEVTVGDDITRNYGLLKDYPQGGGVWGVASMEAFDVTWQGTLSGMVGRNNAIGAQNGNPSIYCSRPLALPIVAPPNISVKIEARSGNGVDAPVINNRLGTGASQNWAAIVDYFQIRCVLEGYKFTMPVG